MHSLPLTSAIALGAVLIASASAQQLVRDVNATPPSGINVLIRQLLGDSQRLFFTCGTSSDGEALFVTDGTPAGTGLFKDVVPGNSSRLPLPIGMLGGELVFVQDALLWITDGSPTRATFLSSNFRLSLSASAKNLGRVGQRLLFSERGGVAGVRLWASDGTPAGTQTIADLGAGEGASFGSFAVFAAAQGALGIEPWVSDGTPAGTQLLADIVPGGDSEPCGFAALHGTVYFLARNAGLNLSLWRTDGTPAGTSQVREFPGVAHSDPLARIAVANGFLYFARGNDLVRSDGTAASLEVVATNLPEQRQHQGFGNFVVFTAKVAGDGLELWSSDGSQAGTRRLTDVSNGNVDALFAGATEAAGSFFTRVLTTQGWRLLSTDGSPAGTRMIPTDGPFPSVGAELATLGNRVLFNSTAGLSISDGTVAGTQSLLAGQVAFRPGSAARPGVALGDDLLFFAQDGQSGLEPWVSDGTAAGTARVVDLFPGVGSGIRAESELAVVDGLAYFTGAPDGSPSNMLLYRTDGTAAGTVALTQRSSPFFGRAQRLRPHNGLLYFLDAIGAGTFTNRFGLFRTDGSSVVQVPSVQLENAVDYALVDDLVYFQPTSNQLWRSDGSAAGTFPIGSLTTRLLGVHEGLLYFLDSGQIHRTDGTVAGTVAIGNPIPFLQASNLVTVGEFGGDFYWLQTINQVSTLVRCNPLSTTATAVTTFAQRPWKTRIALDAIYLQLLDATSGVELWRCDGSAAGTTLVRDLAPGRESGLADFEVVGAGNRLLLSASDGITGLEPWLSDGTAQGTVQLLDANPEGSSNPFYLGTAGSRCFFLLDDGVVGLEPWAAPLGTLGAASVQPLGRGCAGSAGVPALSAAAPLLGSPAYRLALSKVPAGGLSVLLLGTERAPSNLASGCLLWPAGATAAGLVQADLRGRADWALPIPSAAGLLGVELTAQAAALDAFGTALPGLSTSAGLLLVIGD